MEDKNYLNDLKEIKEMMSKSTQFISLSGLSGVLAGIYALVGAYFANTILYANTTVFSDIEYIVISQNNMFILLGIAFTVVTLSIITGIALSSSKAKKNNEKIWNPTSYRLIINFLIPLAVGGYLCLYLIEKEDFRLVAPLMLIFYGLACVNASKYTLGDVRYLGLTMILIGIINTFFIGYGLLFWALGFGFCHIFYGGMMWFKYERK
ncbi:MAG: hypothetical protein V4666_03385 [Bacteroidota bacterium]